MCLGLIMTKTCFWEAFLRDSSNILKIDYQKLMSNTEF